jgi:hypothetical protein
MTTHCEKLSYSSVLQWVILRKDNFGYLEKATISYEFTNYLSQNKNYCAECAVMIYKHNIVYEQYFLAEEYK